jgi:hypothetical protein
MDQAAHLEPSAPARGVALERYLGVASVVAGLVGVLAMFGSVDALWDNLAELGGAFYRLVSVLVS